jgi:hypothetical protein
MNETILAQDSGFPHFTVRVQSIAVELSLASDGIVSDPRIE